MVKWCSMSRNMCKIDGCKKPVHGLGLCSKHYQRNRFNGDPTKLKPKKQERKCSIEDCNKKHESKGYCSAHYFKFRKYGDPLFSKQESHGMSETPEYNAWVSMKSRCYNPKNQRYSRYGGRGIEVYAEWIESFKSFYDHIGKKPEGDFQLDRIENDRGYFPGNIRWATRTTNNRNRSFVVTNIEEAEKIRMINKEGIYTQKQIGEIFGIKRSVVYNILSGKSWKKDAS